MLNPTKTLHVALVLQWIFIAVTIAAEVGLQHTLPDHLRYDAAANDESLTTTLDHASFIAGCLGLLAFLVSSIGLWLRHRWARRLYLIVTLLFPLLTLTDPPSAHPVVVDMIEEYSCLVPGFILALCYFGPVRFRDTDPA